MNAAKITKALEYLADKHCAEFACTYGEPGYSDPAKGIVLANWNNVPDGLGDWLERCGYSLEWSDEWTVVNDKAYRTSPDSYHWESQLSVTDNGEYLSPDDSDADWIDEFAMTDRGQPVKCLPSRIDPASEGFTLYAGELESGHHSGQTDNPDVIAHQAFESGAERVVFRKVENSQFYCRFECWMEAP